MRTTQITPLTNNKTNFPLTSSSLFLRMCDSSKKPGAHGAHSLNSLPQRGVTLTKERTESVPAHQQPPAESWFVSLQAFRLAYFDDRIVPSPGYRLHDGQIWLEVTPQLLGWMAARIELGLRAPCVSEDLAAAIDLFHQARDASGLDPISVPPTFVPPGVGLDSPADWESQRRNAWERYSGTRAALDAGTMAAHPVPVGSRVKIVGRIETASGDVTGAAEVAAAGRDGHGSAWVTLTRGERVLACGVSVDRVRKVSE